MAAPETDTGPQGTVEKHLVSISGTILNAPQAPALPKQWALRLMWAVTATSPDYLYLFGRGETGGEQFELRLDAEPPEAALNAGLFGIGMVELVDPTDDACQMDESKVDLERWKSCGVLGASAHHAVIFTTPALQEYPDEEGELDWLKALPLGFSCGRCVEAKEGETFDTFEPVDCKDLEIVMGKSIGECNWT
jgi:hypothetical protein